MANLDNFCSDVYFKLFDKNVFIIRSEVYN